MSRILYCRHASCRAHYISDAGKIPAICPACQRPAVWSTEPDSPTVDGPSQRFLRAIGIYPD